MTIIHVYNDYILTVIIVHNQQACIQMQVHLHLQVQMRHLHLHLHLNAPRWAHLHLHLHLNRRHLHLHLHLIQMHLIGFKCHSNANQMRLECNIINDLHKIDAIHRCWPLNTSHCLLSATAHKGTQLHKLFTY